MEEVEEAAPGQAPWKVNHLSMQTDFSVHLHWYQVEEVETVVGAEVEGEEYDLQLVL